MAAAALPCRSQVSVIGELSQDHQVMPGQQIEGTITVRNDATEPEDVKIYQTDYLFFRDGTNQYGEPGSTPRSNARWIAFSPSYVTVPPKSSLPVRYTITVPADTAGRELVGTYWSMIMVEGISGSAESPHARTNNQMGIRQTIRYAVQIATTIAQTGTRKIQFLDAKLLPGEGGRKYLQLDIENTGEIGFRSQVSVELFDSTGASKGKFHGSGYRLYPGTSVRERIDLTAVPRGEYRALVVVDAGGEEAFGAQYTLKL